VALIIAGDHHKRYLEVLLESIIMRQILHLFASFLKRQPMIGKIDH
jgi:hypothetical protein